MEQIKNLINGEKRTVRKDNDAKYATAMKATSHIGYAGTSHDERSRVADIVARENEQTMLVDFNGHRIELTREYSRSGKTWWWLADIEEHVARQFVNTDGILKSYTLTVRMDCTVDITKCVRKSERCQWRCSIVMPVDESYVTILDKEVANE